MNYTGRRKLEASSSEWARSEWQMEWGPSPPLWVTVKFRDGWQLKAAQFYSISRLHWSGTHGNCNLAITLHFLFVLTGHYYSVKLTPWEVPDYVKSIRVSMQFILSESRKLDCFFHSLLSLVFKQSSGQSQLLKSSETTLWVNVMFLISNLY